MDLFVVGLVGLIMAVAPLGTQDAGVVGTWPDDGAVAIAPGDALALDQNPLPVAHAPSTVLTSARTTKTDRRPPVIPPAVPVGIGLGGAMLAAGLLASGRRRDDEPYFVLVHGHGGSSDDFDVLIERMGIDPSRTVAFDYRTVLELPTSADASRVVSTAQAAAALDAFIRTVAERHGNIYSIHHSRGGAVGVEMIAALDRGQRSPIAGYRGAALLDPAVATGAVGVLQRLGRFVPGIPDNGGFDPIRCDESGCRDIRSHLGEASGVGVIAIRNPDALVTNFTDDPEGLRVYDLVDDGRPTALAWWWNVLAMGRRVFEAHGSVRTHQAVAECVLAEATAIGTCDWKGNRRIPTIWWGRGNGANIMR